MFQAEPIGIFYSSSNEKYLVPSQPTDKIVNEGVIILKPNQQFEQALEGLEEFNRIWIVFWFHLNPEWKPKILPPRGGKKRGVFATRSPHRPNGIGISNVELKAIQGLKLYISQHDLINETPILDIKPYINEADGRISASQGWLEEIDSENKLHEINWTKLAQEQVSYLQKQWDLDLKSPIEIRLKINPFPYPNNRIKEKEGFFEMAYKTWRIHYTVESNLISILRIISGYDRETLEGTKLSRWPDVPIHLAFEQAFN